MRSVPVSRALAWKLLALLTVGGLLLWQWFDPRHRPDFSDFQVYWVAGQKALTHRSVYDVEGHYQYKYSPFVALLWAIPRALPGARYHWQALHYAATGLGFLCVWYVFARALDRKRALWLWLALLFVFSVGLRDELKLGQANLWPFLMVLPAWFAGEPEDSKRRIDWPGLAIGALWAFAVQWKLYALILAPLWLMRKRPYVWLGALAFTALSLYGALALAHGSAFAIAENARWVKSLFASSEELLISQYNVSALGVFGKWSRMLGVSFGAWAYVLWAGLLVAFISGLFWAERQANRTDAPFLRFWSASWAWAWVAVLNPLVWPYWLLLCLPLFLSYVADAALRSRRVDAVFWIVCALFAAANWLQNDAVVHNGASFVATLVLLFDAQRRARRHKQRRHALKNADGLSLSSLPPLTQRSR